MLTAGSTKSPPWRGRSPPSRRLHRPYAKQAARAALELDLKRGLDLELDLFALLAPTKDRLEAAQAFAERREPRFTGE